MDVEGYEHHVLLGAMQLLTERHVPFLVIEFSRDMMGAHGKAVPDAFVSLVHALGYR